MTEPFDIGREIVRMKAWYRAPPSCMTKAQCDAVLFALTSLREMNTRARNGGNWQECRLTPEETTNG